MMRRFLAVGLTVVAVLTGQPAARADPPEGMPVVILDQPGVPVRFAEIQSVVSLMPVEHTLTTVWFVRGVVTNVTQKRIVRIEMLWTMVNSDGAIVGTTENVYETPISPGDRSQRSKRRERRKTVIGVLTDLLHKRGARVIGLVRRVRFEDGSLWTAPPADIGKTLR